MTMHFDKGGNSSEKNVVSSERARVAYNVVAMRLLQLRNV